MRQSILTLPDLDLTQSVKQIDRILGLSEESRFSVILCLLPASFTI